jgi:hypothetical protein
MYASVQYDHRCFNVALLVNILRLHEEEKYDLLFLILHKKTLF